MSAMAVSLPMERAYLRKAFLTIVGIVLAVAVTMSLTLSWIRSDVTTPRPPSKQPAVERIADVGTTSGRFTPITIDGKACPQCR